MRFIERLYIAVKRGDIATHDGGIIIPRDKDMRSIFPNMNAATYTSVRRSMLRAGFYYCARLDAWFSL
jgi:hypothetical protein